MQQSTEIDELKRAHEALYTRLMRARQSENLNDPSYRSTLVSESRTLIGKLSDSARIINLLDDYTWLVEALLQWHIAFSSVLEETLRQEIPDPPTCLIASPRYLIDDHVKQYANYISLWRRLNQRTSIEDQQRDWYQAEMHIANDILEGRINLAEQVDTTGLRHLENVWFRDLIQLKAYYHWMDRTRSSKQQSTDETMNDYLYACRYYRWRLLDERSKASHDYFGIVYDYIKEAASRIETRLMVGECEKERAERYVRKFYYNIGPAVLKGDEEGKKRVVDAILESEGPGSPLSIMNALEAAIAIYFLRDPEGFPEEWYQEAKDFEDRAL